jgi:hypothetical protein
MLPGTQADELLDKISFFNELEENLNVKAFQRDLYLGKHFVTVSTFEIEDAP